MRILVLQETDWVTRNPIMHHRMLEALALAGADVTVIDYEILWAQKGTLPLWQGRRVIRDCHKFFEQAPITILRPGMLRLPVLSRLSWLAGNWRALTDYFADGRPDVIVAYGISNAYLAQRFARRHGVPFVYHLMDALHTLAESYWQQPIACAVERAVLQRADHVVVINNKLREYAVQMGAAAQRVTVIPMGTNITSEMPADEIEAVRAGLQISPQDFVMLFMGWLYDFSGLRELTVELARRKAAWPQLKLLVVGDGDLLPELQRLRQTHGLEQHLILTGRRPMQEMRGYIAASDLCLLPAHRNTTMEHIVPAKVIEYMEIGRPVLATRLPGLEAEFDDLPGLLYIERPEDAFDRLEELLQATPSPRQVARRLGATCREFLQRREDWAGVTKRFEQVLSTTRVRERA
ncbi:MAG: glycosyltransferase family 4 protein [Acidobacteria bacterium]|nr:glycosyltransferase family 4 protein [Acidobacteriota bacterium]MBI3427415.1 glycosyltransferase family 4 protein [Acidobacteriota bacterium]